MFALLPPSLHYEMPSYYKILSKIDVLDMPVKKYLFSRNHKTQIVMYYMGEVAFDFFYSPFLHFTTTIHAHSLFLLDFESCLLKVWCEVIFYLSENIFIPVQTNVQHTFYNGKPNQSSLEKFLSHAFAKMKIFLASQKCRFN